MGFTVRNDGSGVVINKWQRRISIARFPVAMIALILFPPQGAMALHVQSTVQVDAHSVQSHSALAKADYEALRERLGNARDSDGNFEALRERLWESSSSDGPSRVSCRRCDHPESPEAALESGAEGSPVVRLTFDEDGHVIDAVIEQSSGDAALDQAALEAAQRFILETDGSSGQVPVEIDFDLEGIEEQDKHSPSEPSE